MTRHYYFAYGSNTHLDQMSRRCPDAVCIGPAVLPNYALVFRIHADVELDSENYVEGLLWDISDDDLLALDTYEGFPDYYLRQRVYVEHNDELLVAWVYSMNEQDIYYPPGQTYLRVCEEGYRQNNLNVSQLHQALKIKGAAVYDSYYRERTDTSYANSST